MKPAFLGVAGLATTLGLTSADCAVVLLLLGILLLYAEFNRPGTILLGAAGTLLFMLGVYKSLPLQFSMAFAGLAVLGLALLLVELRFPLRSLHAAGAGTAACALILALRNLVLPPNQVHWAIAIFTGIVFSAVTYTLGHIALLAARNKRLPRAAFAASNLKPYPASAGNSGCTE